MKYSQLYKDAALCVDKSTKRARYFGLLDVEYHHSGCCVALSCVGATAPMNKAFKKVFGKRRELYWFGEPWSACEKTNKERKDHRVFALLLMAELAKDQGL